MIVAEHPKYGRRYLTPTAAAAYRLTPADAYDGRSWRRLGTIPSAGANRRRVRSGGIVTTIEESTTTTTETS